MDRINTIVLDDEWYNLEEICTLTEQTGLLQVVGRYQNPLVALEEVRALRPQVAFVDIEMPEMDGITLSERLLEIDPGMQIVFITSFNQYAVQAFDINALDYVMKPIREVRFARMVEKLRGYFAEKGHLSETGLTVRCFDRLEAFIGGVPVKWERAKAEELFAYLLLHHNSYIHKDTLIEELWPEYSTEKALPILQTAVCKIRSVLSPLGEKVSLTYSASKYRLYLPEARCDYFETEAALSAFRPNIPATFTAIERACSQYGGGLLAHEGYVWSVQRDANLRVRLIEVLRQIGVGYLDAGEDACAVRYLHCAACLAPYEEELNLALLNALWRLGRTSKFLDHYRQLEETLREQYDKAPSRRITDLVDSIRGKM